MATITCLLSVALWVNSMCLDVLCHQLTLIFILEDTPAARFSRQARLGLRPQAPAPMYGTLNHVYVYIFPFRIHKKTRSTILSQMCISIMRKT